MDQLRKAWGWLVRYHFWVLTVLTTLIAAYCWYSGATTLQQEFSSNKSKIDSQFTAISGVRSAPFKPNGDINTKQQEQIDVQKTAVRGLWQQLYDRQRAHVLKWPSNLSEQFRSHVGQLKFLDEIRRDLRDHYNNYVRDHFPELPKIVGAKLAEDGQSSGGRGSVGGRGMMDTRGMDTGHTTAGAGAMDADDEYLVDWVDQDVVRSQLYMASTPSSKRIWKTQEDLWVYEALLNIIAATNKAAGADRFSNAAVRIIQSIEVGQPAARHSRSGNRIDMPELASSAGDEFAGDFDGGRDMGGGGIDSGGAVDSGRSFGGVDSIVEGTGADGADDEALFMGRYIGPDGMPIASADPTQFGNEFKRLPIRLQLWMDERWLPQLIAECASAPLQVDVQEVRINPSNAESSGNYSSRGGDSRSMSGQSGDAMAPNPEPYMKTVILQGIIYIFNPPTDQTADSGLAGVQ